MRGPGTGRQKLGLMGGLESGGVYENAPNVSICGRQGSSDDCYEFCSESPFPRPDNKLSPSRGAVMIPAGIRTFSGSPAGREHSRSREIWSCESDTVTTLTASRGAAA